MTVSPLSKYRCPLELFSWLAFAISLTFYWITADPGVSYWDCPEYVVSASRLEIGHPPGNPIWMLAMRVATIPFPAEQHAYVINLCSGALMAFAVFFLCRFIFIPICLYLEKTTGQITGKNSRIISGLIALGSSLCFAFCDSTWYSAVEAEVYAMSTFLSAFSLWIIMVWWWCPDKCARKRLLILLAYITGISLGVHQLNLLLIPVFALIIFYRRFRQRVNPGFVIVCVLGACGIIALILAGLMPSLLYGAQAFELFGVNTLALPYNAGVFIFCTLVFALFLILLAVTQKRQTIIWMAAFIMLGYSSFAVIMIRSQASPPMNEGTPSDIFSLASYIAREQYPSTPLVYGATPYSKPMFKEEFQDGSPTYSRYVLEKGKAGYLPVMKGAQLFPRSDMLTLQDSDINERITGSGHGYVVADYAFRQMLTPELNMWFPRITSRNHSDIAAYGDWAGMTLDNMEKVEISEAVDSTGKNVPKLDLWGKRVAPVSQKPTYAQNLRFFLSYQAYYMYFRYLFWNFIGRQNDFPSMGEIEHGNFITGFPFFDTFLGVTPEMPPEIGIDNKGRNRYFGIPFIVGIVGALWLLFNSRKSHRVFCVIFLTFLMTGLAIVVYLNQGPGEPRERDYTFLVSYMAFCMWIAAGILALTVGGFEILRKLKRSRPSLLKSCLWSVALVFSFGIPLLMLLENFDDHDRRGRFEPSFYASSILDFEIPAIIFSFGDNSTFPLWYASEMAGSRSLHTPVDVTYLSLPGYIENLRKQGTKGLSTISTTPQTAYGRYVLTKIPSDTTLPPMPLPQLLRQLYASDAQTPEFVSSKVWLPVSQGDSTVVNLKDLSGGSSYLSFKHLMLLDIIASQLESDNPKVIFFPSILNLSFYRPLSPILSTTLFGKIYAPRLSEAETRGLMKEAIERELVKLNNIDTKTRYSDPLSEDRSKRYRGELIIGAQQLMAEGDTATALRIADAIERKFPYSRLLPGDFTIADTTFYEGKNYIKLMLSLADYTGNPDYEKKAENLDSLISNRRKTWLRYYNSLTPEQRATLSNRSRRLLLK